MTYHASATAVIVFLFFVSFVLTLSFYLALVPILAGYSAVLVTLRAWAERRRPTNC